MTDQLSPDLGGVNLDNVSVLSSCQPAAQVARSCGLELAIGQPVFGGRYIVVVPDASGLDLVTRAEEQGFTVVATVAWRLPAAIVGRLAALSAPVVVGMPTRQALQTAIVRGNTDQMREAIARWSAVESYFSRPAAHNPRPYALTPRAGED